MIGIQFLPDITDDFTPVDITDPSGEVISEGNIWFKYENNYLQIYWLCWEIWECQCKIRTKPIYWQERSPKWNKFKF